LVDQDHGSRVSIVGGEFLDVDDSTVGDAPGAFEPGAALAFHFLRGLRLATQQYVSAEKCDAARCHESIQSKRIHTKRWVKSAQGRRLREQDMPKAGAGGSSRKVTKVTTNGRS